MDGFTFDGVHTSRQACFYTPDAKARGEWTADFDVRDITDDVRDGGYFIGVRVKPRVFSLTCYFEGISASGLETIQRWLYRGRQGRQIFDERPFVYYDVAVTRRAAFSLYDHTTANGDRIFSGTFDAGFTAYEPFGKMLRTSYEDAPMTGEAEHTGILPAEMMPVVPTAAGGSFLMYNPGTERAQTVIRIAGDVGDGVVIRNLTTGQRCKIINLKPGSLLEGACLELDSAMGQTRIVLGNEREQAFAFHDEGYLTLAPCTPFTRAIPVFCTEGSSTIASEGEFLSYMEGQYVNLGGWKKIREVLSADQAILAQAADTGGTVKTPMVTMNEIEVQSDGAQLSRLEIEYTPSVM